MKIPMELMLWLPSWDPATVIPEPSHASIVIALFAIYFALDVAVLLSSLSYEMLNSSALV